MTIDLEEFAEHCRSTCPHPAQGHEDGRLCGAGHEDEHDGEMSYSFCGHHWGALIAAGVFDLDEESP